MDPESHIYNFAVSYQDHGLQIQFDHFQHNVYIYIDILLMEI